MTLMDTHLQEVRSGAVQYPWGALRERRRVESIHTLASSLNPDKLDISRVNVPDKGVEHADRVGTPSDTRYHVVWELSRQVEHLEKSFDGESGMRGVHGGDKRARDRLDFEGDSQSCTRRKRIGSGQ